MKPPSTTNTCVVAIVTHTASLSAWEEISLRQCDRVLSDHDLVLVCPRGMDTSAHLAVAPRLRVLYVRPRWLSSYERFSYLKLSPVLYRAFDRRGYTHVLFHELDAFVFRDELQQWCAEGYDYIGAPWFSGRPHYGDDSVVIGAGNGGFSLRNIRSHVRANRSLHYLVPPRDVWKGRHVGAPANRAVAAARLGLKLLGIGNNTCYYLRAPGYRLGRNIPAEDLFWVERMSRALGWFKVADASAARRFSFEILPRRLYEMNDHQLPFGCHGWYRFDLEFWRPFVESAGFVLPTTPTPQHHQHAE